MEWRNKRGRILEGTGIALMGCNDTRKLIVRVNTKLLLQTIHELGLKAGDERCFQIESVPVPLPVQKCLEAMSLRLFIAMRAIK